MECNRSIISSYWAGSNDVIPNSHRKMCEIQEPSYQWLLLIKNRKTEKKHNDFVVETIFKNLSQMVVIKICIPMIRFRFNQRTTSRLV